MSGGGAAAARRHHHGLTSVLGLAAGWSDPVMLAAISGKNNAGVGWVGGYARVLFVKLSFGKEGWDGITELDCFASRLPVRCFFFAPPPPSPPPVPLFCCSAFGMRLLGAKHESRVGSRDNTA